MLADNLNRGDKVRLRIDGKRREGRVCDITAGQLLIVSGLNVYRFNRKSLTRRNMPADRIVVDGALAGRRSKPRRSKRAQKRVAAVKPYAWQEGVQK